MSDKQTSLKLKIDLMNINQKEKERIIIKKIGTNIKLEKLIKAIGHPMKHLFGNSIIWNRMEVETTY